MTNPYTIIAYSRAMKDRNDTFDFWSTYQKPVFLIAGAKDAGIPMQDSTKMIDAISLGNGIILPETGHMGFMEMEKETLEFIEEFLKAFMN